MSVLIRFVLAALVVLGFWLTSGPALAAEWRDVTDDRLLNAGSDGANWLMYSRTYSGWRLSPHRLGVASSNDEVIFGHLAAYLVALEAKTGKPVWETKIADYAEGYFVSQAPMVVKGKVIVGISGPGEMGPRGFVEAFDAE